MKPRIRLRFGIWTCGVITWEGFRLPPYGNGNTPKEAYQDWKEQIYA